MKNNPERGVKIEAPDTASTASVPIQYGRHVGNTTRRIDFAVQELFSGKKVHVVDHNPTEQDNRRLLKLIIKRLYNEHGIIEKQTKVTSTTYIAIQLIATKNERV